MRRKYPYSFERNWEIRTCDFSQPSGVGDGYLNTSLILVEHGYKLTLVLASLPCFSFVLSLHLMLIMLLPFAGTDDRGLQEQ